MAAVIAGATSQMASLDLGSRATDVLMPARKRLSSVEAERIISVLELALKKIDLCQLVLSLTAAPGDARRRALSKLTAHTQECLGDFGSAREAFEEAVASGTEAALMYEFEAFTEVTKNLLRSLGREAGPDVAAAVADAGAGAGAGNDGDGDAAAGPAVDEDAVANAELQSGIVRLRDVLFQKLLTTVDEERRQQGYLSKMTSQEQHSNAEIAKLQAELDELKATRADEIGKREAKIERVTEELYSIVQHGQTVTARIDADADKKIGQQEELYREELARLETEVDGHAKNLTEIRGSHRTQEEALKKKKFKIETQISSWISKYDAEMGAKQTEIDDITRNYEKEKKQLEDLRERFVKVNEEYSVIMEAQRAERSRQETAAAQNAKMERAASTIQRSWKGYKDKKAATKAAKGKGKKGKGSGKKKKKKK